MTTLCIDCLKNGYRTYRGTEDTHHHAPPLKESDEKPCDFPPATMTTGASHETLTDTNIKKLLHTPMNESKPQDWHKGSEFELGYQEGVKAERARLFALIENLSSPYHESLLALLQDNEPPAKENT